MIGAPPFPVEPAALTADFLSAALGRDVRSFAATQIGADRGMLGVVVRLDLELEGLDGTDTEPCPTSLVAKFAALRDGSLDSARRGGTHERELRFYDELAHRTPVAAPELHGAWYDPETAHFLLLQDVVETDTRVDQIKGITVGQAEAVLAEAARLHATWWDNDDLAALDWLPALDSEARRNNLGTLAKAGWGPMCEVVGDELSPHEVELGAEFPQRVDSMLVSAAARPSTLIHSDLRADNLLFAPDGRGVTLIDWQGVGVGPAGWDVAYLLSQCLTVDDRRKHEAHLLDFYRSVLQSCGRSLSIEELHEGYAESMLYGLVIACAIPLISDASEQRVVELTRTMARRSLAAAQDHGQVWGAAA